MSPFPAPIHPAITIALQLTTTILTLGFTSPCSLFRLAALPLEFTFLYLTFQNINEHMRIIWSQIVIASCCVLFIFNFLETSLLRKWTFEAQGPASHPPSAKPLPTTTAPSKSHASPSPQPKDTILNRLKFGWSAAWSIRDIGSAHELNHVPHFSPKDPGYTPSKPAFLLRSLATFALAYLFLDLAESLPQPPDTEKFSPAYVPVLARLRVFGGSGEVPVTGEEAAVRIGTSAMVWVCTYCLISCWVAMLEIVFVGPDLTEAKSWRPLFGSFKEAYTLRGFWGKSWHQLLRKPLNNPAIWMVDDVLHLPKGLVSRYLKIFVTFFLSGFLHLLADLTAGHALAQSGALNFFCVQVLGIMLEDLAQEMYRRAGGNGGKTWTKAVGWVWTVGFLFFWSSPAWFWPQVYKAGVRTEAEWVRYGKMVPFTVFGGFLG